MEEEEVTTGLNTMFELHDGADPGEFDEIAEVFDLDPPDDDDEEHESTHYKSEAREYITGLTNHGTVAFQMNFKPNSASETKILAAKAARKKRACRITWPNGATWAFNGRVKGYKPAAPLDDRMTATVTIRVTGGLVRAAPPAS